MPANLELNSPCKVNLLLNILGRRPDGFHELETLMHPVRLCDQLAFIRGGLGVQLMCSDPRLPVDSGNLVHRAATLFLKTAGISDGVRIHLDKKIPFAAGLGGGSGNAAMTLLGLNELFDKPLAASQIQALASELGSDIPFFLQSKPAIATGRGEKVVSLEPFPALRGAAFLLIHPGFGISTAWAYKNLARFPATLNGKSGRAQKLAGLLQTGSLAKAAGEFYNSLEAPALEKYPLLVIFKEFLRNHGASLAMMSGSGSATFAISEGGSGAEKLLETFKKQFGENFWTAIVPVSSRRCEAPGRG